MTGEYFPYKDSVQNAMEFLNANPQLLSSSNLKSANMLGAINQLKQLQAKMQDAEQIKEFIRQRKKQIKQCNLQFAHLPEGISNI
jgi:hypothetical protein